MKIRQNAIFFLALLCILAACGVLWLWTGLPAAHIPADGGTRDLREADFSSGCFDLFGPVAYIPNALLTPEEFRARSGEVRVGEPARAARYSTSRLRIYVPAGTYGLMMWNAELAANIYINGQLAEQVGVPGRSAQESVPGARLMFFTVAAPDGVIEIVQQASTYVLPMGDSHANLIIGKPDLVRRAFVQQSAMPAAMMGCFLALALAHLALYSLRRLYKANLWFALFCLVWLVRTSCISWLTPSLLNLTWNADVVLAKLTEPAGVLLLTLTLQALFPDVLRKWVRVSLAAACGAYACLLLFVESTFRETASHCFEFVILLYAIAVFAWLCVKVRRPSLEQATVVAGMGLFLLGALRDIVQSAIWPLFQPSGGLESDLTYQMTTEIGLLVFVFFQMVAMFRGTMREVAAAKEAEQKLTMENALLAREAQMRSDMVSTLSHEVRTPLTVISTYAQLAVRQFRMGEIDEQTLDGLDAVYEEAQRIAELATNTLSLQAQEERSIDLADIARHLVRLYMPVARGAGRTLTANLTKTLPAFGSEGEITQVIWNLLDNAFKHGGGGVEVDGNINSESVYIVVTDYGAGIPPDMLPIVLERGASGGGGSGLGLAIADEIARKHGGRLIIESEYGLGTVATLLLPVSRGKEDAPDEK